MHFYRFAEADCSGHPQMGGLAVTAWKTRGAGQPKQVQSGLPCLVLTVLCKHAAALVRELRRKPGQKHNCSIKVWMKRREWPPRLCVNHSFIRWRSHTFFMFVSLVLIELKDCFCKLQTGPQNRPNSHKWSVTHDKSNPALLLTGPVGERKQEPRNFQETAKMSQVITVTAVIMSLSWGDAGIWHPGSAGMAAPSTASSGQSKEMKPLVS